MNCRQAKQNIALFAGNDLDSLSARELQRHLRECPECEKHWHSMKSSVKSLQTCCRETVPVEESVWPELVVRLPKQRVARRPGRFHGWSNRLEGWAPTVAVVAACSLMLMIARLGSPSAAQPGASVRQSANLSADRFNDVFAPDFKVLPPEKTPASMPIPNVNNTNPYRQLFYDAMREVDSGPARSGNAFQRLPKRSGSNRQ